eukprot:5797-Amphidinium_carterae.1
MTCSACSNTIERHLRGLEGVSRATVSLILNRAYVVCDPGQIDPASLCGEIEDIGFDAKLVTVSPVDNSGSDPSQKTQRSKLPCHSNPDVFKWT